MDRMLYVAMSGARQTVLAQSANSNNLANANTRAFRADLNGFRSQQLFGDGHPSRVYAMNEKPGIDFTPGVITQTGRELDMAVDGDGWIAVQAADGKEAYTRAGNLQIGPGRQLITETGEPVLGNDGPVALPPFENFEIGSDGTITIRRLGEAPNALAIVDRIKLVKPDQKQLERLDDGLFRLQNGRPAIADGSVRLIGGALENSNVNPVEAMVNMLGLARQFEMQVKIMHTAEQNEEQTAQLLRLA